MKRIFLMLITLSVLFNVTYLQGNADVVTLDRKVPVKLQMEVKNLPVGNTSTCLSPVDVVKNPQFYLNKTITFDAEFIAFTALGLDYKPAFKDGTKNIGVLIRRPDVENHVIPLSEMKIFLSREMAEKNMDIDAGDKVKITGKVFSTALGDPWVEVTTFTVTSKKSKQ